MDEMKQSSRLRDQSASIGVLGYKLLEVGQRRRTQSPPRYYWINRRYREHAGKSGKVPLGFLSPNASDEEIEAFAREMVEMIKALERQRQDWEDE